MRWSQSMLTLGLIATCLNLAACKKEKTGTSIRTAALGGTPLKTDATEKARRASMSPEQLCYQDLCTSQSHELSYTSLLDKAATPTPAQKAYFQNHLEPLLKQTLDAKVQLQTTTLNQLTTHEADFESAELNQTQLRMIKAIALLAGQGLNSEDKQEVFKKLSSYDFVKASSLAGLKGPEAYFLALHPDQPLMIAAQTEAKATLKLQEELNSSINFRLVDLDHGALARVNAGGGADLNDLKELMNNSYSLRLVHTLTIKSTELTDALPLTLEKIKADYFRSGLKEKIQRRISAASGLQKECEARIYQGLNLYPEVSDVAFFKKASEMVREEVLKNLTPQDPAFDVVKRTVVYMPETINDLSKNWAQRLKDMTKQDQIQTEKMLKMDAATTLFLASVFSISYYEKDPVCEELVDLRISDASYTKETGIKSSWMSVKLPSYGASILAHEFAHLIFAYSSQFTATKSCLADKQGSTQYLNEDFSDALAAKVSLQLQNVLQKKQANYGCFFASMEDTLSLKNAVTTDVHSSSLFRALQLTQGRKETVPESCENLVKQQQSKALNTCEI